MLSDGNWLKDSRYVQAARTFGFPNGTSVSLSDYATHKEVCCLNRELTKQRHELRCQGVEGSPDRRKDKGKPELALSELDRLHSILCCMLTNKCYAICLSQQLPWPDAELLS